jgi:hypothetical protein
VSPKRGGKEERGERREGEGNRERKGGEGRGERRGGEGRGERESSSWGQRARQQTI